MEIEAITTKKQMAALEAAIKTAASKAAALANTEDGGTCNMDTCIIRIKIPKRLREQSSLRLMPCSGFWRGYYFVHDIPSNGCGNRNTRQAEAASKSLCEAGYHSSVYYQID